MAEFLGPDSLGQFFFGHVDHVWAFVWRSALIIAMCAGCAIVLLYAAVIIEALTHPHKPSRHHFASSKRQRSEFLALMHEAQVRAQADTERTRKAAAQQQNELGLSDEEIRTKAKQFHAWTFGPVE